MPQVPLGVLEKCEQMSGCTQVCTTDWNCSRIFVGGDLERHEERNKPSCSHETESKDFKEWFINLKIGMH